MDYTENDLLIKLWLSKITLVKWGIVAAVAGFAFTFFLSKEYQTTVVIATEKSAKNNLSGISELMGVNLDENTVGVTDILYPEIVKSSPFLLEFVNIEVEVDTQKMTFYKYVEEHLQIFNWFKEKNTDVSSIDPFYPTSTQLRYISTLRDRIEVETSKKTNIYRISVKMHDKVIAAVIADSLVQKLQLYMTRYQTSKSKESYQMKQKLYDEAKQRYYEADAEYAKAFDRNRSNLTQSSQIKLERLMNEKNVTFGIYNQMASQVEMSRVKVLEDTPIATIIEPASVTERPVFPRRVVMTVLFGMLGVFIASCKILFLKKHK